MQIKFKLFKELDQRSRTLGFKVRMVQGDVERFNVTATRFASDYDVLESYVAQDGYKYFLVDCMNFSDETLKVFRQESNVYLDVDEIVVY